MHLKKLALIIEYDGGRYHGFQLQPQSPTVQEELEKAVLAFTGERLRVQCASRTDAGVHAQGQVVSFRTAAPYAPEAFMGALNHFLPEDVAVKAAYPIDMDFDVRVRAIGREYRYVVLNRPAPSPLLRHRAYWIAAPLDERRMDEAASLLVGERDFAPFAGALLPEGRSTRRRLRRAEVRREGELVILDVEGDSFMPQQVRRMAGALVEVGLGKMELPEFSALVHCGQRGVAGPTLPAQGLFLRVVQYRDFPPGDGSRDGNGQVNA